MLPPKLREIKNALEKRRIQSSTGEEALLEELRQLERLIDRLKETNLSFLGESFERGAMGVTSGPGGYCTCCGRKL